MATTLQRAHEIFFDSTTARIEDEFGEIPGVMSCAYPPPKRTRGRVHAAGSRKPIGRTPGTSEPGMGSLVMNRKDAVAWIALLFANYGPGFSEKLITFKVMYSPLDEEGSVLPVHTDIFSACVDPPEGLSFDRGQNEAPLMITIPLFIDGDMYLNGVKVE